MATRYDLCKEVAKDLNFREKDVKEVVDLFLDKIVDTLCDDKEKVSLQGFATFEPVTMAPRTARNPRTGEKVQVGETTKIRCKYSMRIKERLKGVEEE